jgi:hypothetical protein
VHALDGHIQRVIGLPGGSWSGQRFAARAASVRSEIGLGVVKPGGAGYTEWVLTMARKEVRFQSGRLRYWTDCCNSGLSKKAFAEALEASLSALQGRKHLWEKPLWLARSTRQTEDGLCGEGRSLEYEVLVYFSRRTRVAQSSTRLGVNVETWSVCVEHVPRHGMSRKEFYRDELQRWGEEGAGSDGYFGPGFMQLGVGRQSYGVVGRRRGRRTGGTSHSEARSAEERGPSAFAERSQNADVTELYEEYARLQGMLSAVRGMRRQW